MNAERGFTWRWRVSRRLLKAAPVLAAVLVLGASAGASAAPQVSSSVGKAGAMPAISDTGVKAQSGAAWLRGTKAALAIPADAENVRRISRLLLGTDEFGPVAPGQVADVAVHNDTAYVISWSQPFDFVANRCFRGCLWSVDISDPANPGAADLRQGARQELPRRGRTRDRVPGRRDGLAVNNEICFSARTPPPDVGGGFELYDVCDPRDPESARARRRRLRRRGGLVCCARARPAPTPRSRTTPLRVHVARRRQGVPGRRRQRRGDLDRRGHLRRHRSEREPKAVPEYDFDKEFGRTRPAGHGQEARAEGEPARHHPPRHGRQGRQRRPDDDRLLLGTAATCSSASNNPAIARIHRRHGFDEEDPLTGVTTPGGQRAPGRVLATTSTSWPRTKGFSARLARSPRANRTPEGVRRLRTAGRRARER